jgi:hypothetical protein
LLAQATYFLYTTSLDETLELCLPLAAREDDASTFAPRAHAVANMANLPALYLAGRMARLNELSARCLREARQRGDRGEEVNALVYAVFRDLARDDLAAAHARLREARAVPLDFTHGVFIDPWWETNFLLYAGDPRAAFQRNLISAGEYWSRIFPAASHRLLYWLSLGNAASGVLSVAGDRKRYLRTLKQCIRRVGRERARLAKALHCQLRAQLAFHGGHHELAAAMFAETALEYEAIGFRLHAAAARLMRAELIDEPAEGPLRLRAAEVFAAEGIVNPKRWASMLIAGIAINAVRARPIH